VGGASVQAPASQAVAGGRAHIAATQRAPCAQAPLQTRSQATSLDFAMPALRGCGQVGQ
jgi:hypothetical protein